MVECTGLVLWRKFELGPRVHQLPDRALLSTAPTPTRFCVVPVALMGTGAGISVTAPHTCDEVQEGQALP
jgi:hypothetical protein